MAAAGASRRYQPILLGQAARKLDVVPRGHGTRGRLRALAPPCHVAGRLELCQPRAEQHHFVAERWALGRHPLPERCVVVREHVRVDGQELVRDGLLRCCGRTQRGARVVCIFGDMMGVDRRMTNVPFCCL